MCSFMSHLQARGPKLLHALPTLKAFQAPCCLLPLNWWQETKGTRTAHCTHALRVSKACHSLLAFAHARATIWHAPQQPAKLATEPGRTQPAASALFGAGGAVAHI